MSTHRKSFEAPADAYDRHVGRYSAQLSRAFIAAVGIAPTDDALDIGCGPGGLTRALADIVGEQRVSAVDPSESFSAACRERVPGADVRRASAEQLPFGDDTFDVVVSQLVVNFLSDAQGGVREMARVARTDGVVAACVWDYAEGMTMLRAFFDAALELDPEAPDEGRTMRYCSEHELRELWQQAGLADVATGALEVEATYESFDDYWWPFPLGVGPSGAYAASLDDDSREALRAACFRRLGEPDGPFTLGARAWFVRGLAPG
jgi:ubiquinone/menaquinone biosynthesis C-methylase UbiE